MYFLLAWKNIWRNKKRTLLVTGSIFFAVLISCFWRSAQIGSFDYMVRSIAKMHLGFLQIQHKSYWENRSLNDSFVLDKQQISQIKNIAGITASTPRIEAVALVSNDSTTSIAQISGIHLQSEEEVTQSSKYVVSGQYFNLGDGAFIAAGMAKKLNLTIGDSLLIYGQGFHGQTAAALIPVKGLLQFPVKKMNQHTVFLGIEKAAEVFGLQNRLTSYAIMIAEPGQLSEVVQNIRKVLDENQTVLTWEQMMPEIKQTIQLKTSSNYILIAILYIVVAFGIFGVIMMMTMEREAEFGILNALGMSKWRMTLIALFENLFIASIGTISGIIAAVPLTLYMSENPIRLTGDMARSWEQMGIEAVFTFSSAPDIFLYQALVVFLISVTCLIYPVLFLQRLIIVNALKK